jgi:iron-regulated transporter 1
VIQVVIIAGGDEACLRCMLEFLSSCILRSLVMFAFTDRLILVAINSQMRRIDLVCKLVGPLAISVIDGISTGSAILCTAGLTISSVTVEYYAIAKVG